MPKYHLIGIPYGGDTQKNFLEKSYIFRSETSIPGYKALLSRFTKVAQRPITEEFFSFTPFYRKINWIKFFTFIPQLNASYLITWHNNMYLNLFGNSRIKYDSIINILQFLPIYGAMRSLSFAPLFPQVFGNHF